MIHIKSDKEIDLMRTGGKILSETLWEVIKNAKEGVSELELDQLAEKLIREKGGESGFKKVPGYNFTVCVSTNDVVVHGIPTDYKLKKGDVIGIDCGVYYKGFHTDMSETVRVGGSENDEIDKFLEIGKKALVEGIKEAKNGNRVGHISKAIQDIVEKENNYSIVRSLIGHGVGKDLHEDPEVPGFLNGNIEKTPLLKKGMTIAVEVIYNMGSAEVVLDKSDGWTIRTKDGAMSGVFERSIVITESDPISLTP